MTEIAALLPGGGWAVLALAAALAGLVRGFTGFGTAMVFLPLAALYLGPFETITAMIAMDIIGPLPAAPAALRVADRRDLRRLALGLMIGTPIGILILSAVSPDAFRYGLSIVAILLFLALVSGWRYAGQLTPRMVVGAGTVGGVFAGAVGLPGPPVILIYMASRMRVDVVRATLLLYLILADLILLALFWAFGTLVPGVLVIGALMIPIYMAMVVLGSRVFDPARERLYRGVAYLIIIGAALRGLPIWG